MIYVNNKGIDPSMHQLCFFSSQLYAAMPGSWPFYAQKVLFFFNIKNKNNCN